MEGKTIGLPQAMYYYPFGESWRRFLESLGYTVVLSGNTDNDVLMRGVRCAGSDLCFPVKLLFGHVDRLVKEQKPDILFLPTVRFACKGCYTCPKTIGLAAMVRAAFRDLPALLSPEFEGDMRRFLQRTGKALNKPRGDIKRAVRAAVTEPTPAQPLCDTAERTVALIGHSYVLSDAFLNMQMEEKLREMRIRCITPTLLPDETLLSLAAEAGYKTPFWYTAGRNLGFAKHVVDNRLADGILFLNAFGCGTDSLSLGFCMDYIRTHSGIPATVISLDEHRAQAGVLTRLEAFTDCLCRGKGAAV